MEKISFCCCYFNFIRFLSWKMLSKMQKEQEETYSINNEKDSNIIYYFRELLYKLGNKLKNKRRS